MLKLEGLQGPLLSGYVWMHSDEIEYRGRQEGNVICHPRLYKGSIGLLSEKIPSLVLEGCQLTATCCQPPPSPHSAQSAAVLQCFIQTFRGQACLPSLCASGISSQTCSSWNPKGTCLPLPAPSSQNSHQLLPMWTRYLSAVSSM